MNRVITFTVGVKQTVCDLDKKINSFLEKNENIEIISTSRSNHADQHNEYFTHYVTIFYKEKIMTL